VDLSLKGKRALVTGSSEGIGRAIAQGLAAEGVEVAGLGWVEVGAPSGHAPPRRRPAPRSS
jgi:NAD(P)-dependent dehydrogenase (short-subunit alcohol dehydrogenase family)